MTDTTPKTPVPAGRYRSTLWAREHRIPTVGLVLVVTLIAFEFMGVATALPTLVADLHGGQLYAWPIAAFTAASAVGTVAGGRICDLRGPGGPMVAGILLFAAGLLVGGTAPTMLVLLLGRVIQGLGAGAEVVSVYVVIAVVYPQKDRPAASALLAAAWVVPSLVGPPVAGVVTQVFGWRWVFLGLVPLVAIGLPLLVPVMRQLRRVTTERRPVRRGVLLAGVGAAIGVSAFTAAAQHLDVVAVPIAVAGLVLLGFSLRRLLPHGTIRAVRGLPAVVLSRALLAGAFTSVESYLPLTLTSVHHYGPAASGLPLTVSALGWAGASAWQGRHTGVSRTTLLRAAFVLVAIGLGTVSLVAWQWAPAWLAYLAWATAGSGMGLGVSSISVLLLDLSPEHERGFNSSAVQLADMLGTVLLVGVGGVLINALGSTIRPSVPVFAFDVAMCGVALFGAMVAAGRTAGRLR
ncbi:MAG TPA: MFS transporter [Pseudonocardiaceae bacterium]|nr:MFS transporter [Pseudonocardiaceae bacterium]